MATSDETLFNLWVRGRDPGAFREILRRHGSAVYGTCLRIMRNEVDAQDAAQDCFEALIGSGKAGGPRKLAAWLHGVATNKCRMRLRAEGRRRDRENAYAAERNVGDEAGDGEFSRWVDEAIEELPEEVGAAVVSHYLYGESHADIARASGVPRRTVSNRIQRGLELMGAYLKSRGFTLSAVALAASLSTACQTAPLPASVADALAKRCLGDAAMAAAAKGACVSLFGAVISLKHLAAGCAIAAALVLAGWWTVRDEGEATVPDVTVVNEEVVVALPDVAESYPIEESVAEPAVKVVGQPGSVSGTARFEETGEPAAGIEIMWYSGVRPAGGISATTDEAGNYMLADIPAPDHGVALYFIVTSNMEGWHAFLDNPFHRFFMDKSYTGVDITVSAKTSSIAGRVFAEELVWHPERIPSRTPALFQAEQTVGL